MCNSGIVSKKRNKSTLAGIYYTMFGTSIKDTFTRDLCNLDTQYICAEEMSEELAWALLAPRFSILTN